MTRPKPSYASDSENPANAPSVSLAHRQLQRILSGPVFWIAVGAATVVMAMAGPYFTLARFSFPERLVYWGTTVTLSALIMTAISVYAYWTSKLSKMNWSVVSVLAGTAGILPVVVTLYLAEGLATGFAPGWLSFIDFPTLVRSVAPTIIFVTLAVHGLIHYLDRDVTPTDTGVIATRSDTPPALTVLQSKLPPHLGHDIISVQAQDHYVEVCTPKGSAMVLMRLKDAVHDLAPLDGMQVHRSWWVNTAHVTRREKGQSGPELLLSSGARVPVGRIFRAAAKQAGLG